MNAIEDVLPVLPIWAIEMRIIDCTLNILSL